jgi:hypothetical protein
MIVPDQESLKSIPGLTAVTAVLCVRCLPTWPGEEPHYCFSFTVGTGTVPYTLHTTCMCTIYFTRYYSMIYLYHVHVVPYTPSVNYNPVYSATPVAAATPSPVASFAVVAGVAGVDGVDVAGLPGTTV